jgi:glutamate decarboxylase
VALHRKALGEAADARLAVRPQFRWPAQRARADREVGRELPRYRIPRGPMDPETAYQLVHDELMLDGNARLNLATFVTTWMDPHADRLMAADLRRVADRLATSGHPAPPSPDAAAFHH